MLVRFCLFLQLTCFWEWRLMTPSGYFSRLFLYTNIASVEFFDFLKYVQVAWEIGGLVVSEMLIRSFGNRVRALTFDIFWCRHWFSESCGRDISKKIMDGLLLYFRTNRSFRRSKIGVNHFNNLGNHSNPRFLFSKAKHSINQWKAIRIYVQSFW